MLLLSTFPACVALFAAALVSFVTAPPPLKRDDAKHDPAHDPARNVSENEVFDSLELEYNRYLQQVVQTLEGDEKFRKMLENVDPEDIKSGKIAQNLDLVSLNVRSKLDEIKRSEVDRLRQLAMLEHERDQGYGNARVKVPGHVDYIRPDKFGQEDLRKLMKQTHKDLEEADRKRKEEFKRYEMEKQYKFKQELEKLPEEEKEKLKKHHEEEVKKHKEHPRIHHPGSKQQLEEVWEKQDHLDPQDFDPRTLFHMHDLDGNGYLDQEEVKLLFRTEIRKAYDPDAPEDDIHEMEEDLERMREHVFNESDANRDALISYDEFMAMVKKDDFNQDPEWHGVEDEEVFSDQEFMEYERFRQEEMQRMAMAGHLPPPHPGMGGPPPPPGYYGYQAPPMPSQGVPGGVPVPHPAQGGYVPHPQQGGVPHPPQPGSYQQQQYAPQAGHPQAYQQVPVGQHQGYVQQPLQGQPQVQQYQQPQQQQYQQYQQPVQQQPPQQVPQSQGQPAAQQPPAQQVPQQRQQQQPQGVQQQQQQHQQQPVAPPPSVPNASGGQGVNQQQQAQAQQQPNQPVHQSQPGHAR